MVIAITMPAANPSKYIAESVLVSKLATGINNKKCAIPAKPCKNPTESEAKLLCLIDWSCV